MSGDFCGKLDGLASISALCACCFARLHPSASYLGFKSCSFRRYVLKAASNSAHFLQLVSCVPINAYLASIARQRSLLCRHVRLCPRGGVQQHQDIAYTWVPFARLPTWLSLLPLPCFFVDDVAPWIFVCMSSKIWHIRYRTWLFVYPLKSLRCEFSSFVSRCYLTVMSQLTDFGS